MDFYAQSIYRTEPFADLKLSFKISTKQTYIVGDTTHELKKQLNIQKKKSAVAYHN